MKLLVIVETLDGQLHIECAANPEAVRSAFAKSHGSAWTIFAATVPARLDCRVMARELAPIAATRDRVATVRRAWEICFGSLEDWRTKAKRRAETGIEVEVHPADALIDHSGGRAPRVWYPCQPLSTAAPGSQHAA